MNPPSEFGLFYNCHSDQLDWFNFSVGQTPFRQDCRLIPAATTTLYPRQGPHMIELFPGGRTAYYAQYIAQLQSIIASWLPLANYDGMIVLDYEWFSPWWTGHNNVHSDLPYDAIDWDPIDDWRDTLSITRAAALVGLTPEQKEAYFKAEWMATTREFFERTFQAVKAVRPNAKVGFYNQPTQDYWGWRDPAKAAAMRTGHDEVPWFWQMVDVIYPSLFSFFQSVPDHRLAGQGQDHESDFDAYCRANVNEALRVANGKPVYPYVCYQYHVSNTIYADQPVNDINMRHPLDVARTLGCNGVVVWGWIRTQHQFDQLSYFITNTYSPYLTRFATLPAYAPANPARPQRGN